MPAVDAVDSVLLLGRRGGLGGNTCGQWQGDDEHQLGEQRGRDRGVRAKGAQYRAHGDNGDNGGADK